MATDIQTLRSRVQQHLAEDVLSLSEDRGELTLVVAAARLHAVLACLRDADDLSFSQCVDLCGVDYSAYRESGAGPRFAVVYHLLSLQHNCRLRVRAFAENDDFPKIPSVIDLWPGVDWFEREAFDLYGIVFEGHPDLRRILTDYGFIGYPFRKDFPLSGHVEMRYDPEQQRVIYQPVTVEPREVTPRIIREEGYGG